MLFRSQPMSARSRRNTQLEMNPLMSDAVPKGAPSADWGWRPQGGAPSADWGTTAIDGGRLALAGAASFDQGKADRLAEGRAEAG